MDPNIKQVFIDVHRWTRDNAYTVCVHCVCVLIFVCVRACACVRVCVRANVCECVSV